MQQRLHRPRPTLAERAPSWHHLTLNASTVDSGSGRAAVEKRWERQVVGRLPLEDERGPQHVTEGHIRMKRISAAVVVVLLVLAGRTGDLGSTPSQEDVIGPSAIRQPKLGLFSI